MVAVEDRGLFCNEILMIGPLPSYAPALADRDAFALPSTRWLALNDGFLSLSEESEYRDLRMRSDGDGLAATAVAGTAGSLEEAMKDSEDGRER